MQVAIQLVSNVYIFFTLCFTAHFENVYTLETEVKVLRGPEVQMNPDECTVCPNETLLIYCATHGNYTKWKLNIYDSESQSRQYKLMSYFVGDKPFQRTQGSITESLDSTQPFLKSHVELPYLLVLNNTNILCRDETDVRNFTYKIACIPPAPEKLDYNFMSHKHVKLQWSPVESAEYYLISLMGLSYEVVTTNTTSVLVSDYYEGMNVTVYSVNKCNMRSSTFISRQIKVADADWREWLVVKTIIYLSTAVTVLGIIIVLVLVTLIIVLIMRYHYKKRKLEKLN